MALIFNNRCWIVSAVALAGSVNCKPKVRSLCEPPPIWRTQELKVNEHDREEQ
jgi:hypothetical protein